MRQSLKDHAGNIKLSNSEVKSMLNIIKKENLKPYRAPKIKVHGSLVEITKLSKVPGSTDGLGSDII
jgi:hypothetical protein